MLLAVTGPASAAGAPARARDLGVAPGIFAPGTHNAITDVAGVRVGHATIIEGDAVRTGVTAVVPHGGNLYLERVPAAVYAGNAFGKLAGSTQVAELGEIESPILLTCTLCVWKAADALAAYMLEQPGMAEVRSVNPLVGETNDGWLNDIRSRPISAKDVRQALESARGGPVAEGSVGAGTGTVAFGWKGGIGTSSRRLPKRLGGFTAGVLVQSNFDGVLQILGAPVGRELGRYAFMEQVTPEVRNPAVRRRRRPPAPGRGDGSVMIVVATDAPLLDRNLRRLGARAIMGLARTGSSAANGSGDYVVAFSTAEQVRRRAGPAASGRGTGGPDRGAARPTTAGLADDDLSPLFQAVVEATEEAIYNSLFAATTVTGQGRTVEALPLDRVREILKKYNVGNR
ncbi:MAG: P1 family peptidase [Acidobacteria bacterium]|nr:P1 family peptidase [Acidobacteriota bacterium]